MILTKIMNFTVRSYLHAGMESNSDVLEHPQECSLSDTPPPHIRGGIVSSIPGLQQVNQNLGIRVG